MIIDTAPAFLAPYPKLQAVVALLTADLRDRHPTVFGKDAKHPVLPVKKSKVIHDCLWGTVRFTWRETILIDSPVLQRLRDLHQTGLAFHVYPSARHSRFEHSLGAATIASRIFDALLQKQRDEIRDIVRSVDSKADQDSFILKLKQELRLAALLHDTGHSLFSHTSELVYEKLPLLQEASKELSKFVGKEKGAGEVLSFCLALSPAIAELLERTSKRLIGDTVYDDYSGAIDLINVALLIVGRASHPLLHFLGDVVSSGFDADKLDYLLRDAKTAGLPLTYDIDRYLYDVGIEKETLADGEGSLEKLYSAIRGTDIVRSRGRSAEGFPSYDVFRLRLSRRAMNVIEQIIICKMMLFSYIYHHGKVRAAEGLLAHLLDQCVTLWRAAGETDEDILRRFLRMTDASLYSDLTTTGEKLVTEYAYRVANRLLPREVYAISGPSGTHAQAAPVQDFLADLQDRRKRERIIGELEKAIGEELVKRAPELGQDPYLALAQAGVRVDAPKPPKFEDVNNMVKDAHSASDGTPLSQIFPIREWTQAYAHYRYQVRIFAFSEYFDVAAEAGKSAMQRVLNISSPSFFDSIRRSRR